MRRRFYPWRTSQIDLLQSALKDSEQRYRTLMDNLSMGVVVHGADTAIQLANPTAATLLGLTLDQLRGRVAVDPAWCFLREDGTPMTLAEYPVNRVLSSGQVLEDLVVGVHHPDREGATWLLCGAYPVREADTLVKIVVTFADITARKKSEAALAASEERWKFAIEGAGDGLWDWNLQTNQAFFSRRYKEMYGYDEADFGTGADEWSKRLHPDDAPGVFAALQPYMDGRPGSAEVEFRMLCKDGSWKWTLGRGMVMERDAENKPLRMIGTNGDISARKATEETLHHIKRLMDRTENMVHLASFEWDVDLDLVTWSPEMFRIFGRDPALGVPNLAGQQELYTPASAQLLYEAVNKALAEGVPYELELMAVRVDGTQRPCSIKAYPDRDASGRVIRITGLVQDITEQKEYEKERLKIDRLESLGVLAGGIAHDFNNILTGVLGNISFALASADPSQKSYQLLTEAERASKRAAELARQLLTFARGGEPIKTTISVKTLVRESVSLVLSGSKVRAVFDFAEALQTIEGDEGQISQVITNLMINAAQAMPAGGTVTVTARNETLPSGQFVRLSFADEGGGIPAEDLPRIYDPYFTTKPAGTGLGLASARSIINRHGGTIQVDSTGSSGTTFSLFLPSTGLADTSLRPAGLTKGKETHQGGTVLVMDDEKSICDMTAAMLVYLGYQAVTCTEGAAAVAAYQEALMHGKAFVAVIMDLTIPAGLGGKEAAQKILALDPAAKLIVSSGYSNDPILADFPNYGFRAAIAKPFTLSEFSRVLAVNGQQTQTLADSPSID